MTKNRDCSCGRSQMLTLAMPDQITIDVLTVKNLALLVGQSFYNVQGTRVNDIFLTSLKSYLEESSTAEEVDVEKLSALLQVYLDTAPDLLLEAQNLLEQAGDQLSFILAASGHGVASGKRDDE